MNFLNRRRSKPQLTDATPTPTITERARAISTSIGKARSSRLIKRVSMIFSPQKKDSIPPHLQPLCNISRRRPSHSLYSSRTSSTTSLDDIRPPSGLGSSVPRLARGNSLSSNTSLPSPPSNRLSFYPGGHERSRCLSSPGILRIYLKAHEPPPWIDVVPPPSTTPKTPTLNLPAEVLDVLLSFLSRSDVASLGVVSKRFCSAVRQRLYSILDLRILPLNRVEQLNSLLASRPDLAEIVHTLICDRWPPLPTPPPRASIYRLSSLPFFSSLPSSSSTFGMALRNMRRLTSLTVPSFDPTIFSDNHEYFRLRNLTFLQSTMSADEQKQLFAWLVGQPDILSLSFPNLAEQTDHTSKTSLPPLETPGSRDTIAGICELLDFAPRSSPLTPTTPTPWNFYPGMSSQPTTPIAPCDINNPSSLLPALTSLHAPPTLITLLAPTRPLKQVTIHIRTNLDTGLRPSALITAIHGTACLSVRFGANVDKRSVEKMMRAAAKVLGGGCQQLDVEIGLMISNETLYKIIQAVIPCFIVLHTLTLHRSAPVPAVLSVSSPSLTDTHHSTHSSADADFDLHQNEDEHAHLNVWLKHCPTLTNVTFLSQAKWHIGLT